MFRLENVRLESQEQSRQKEFRLRAALDYSRVGFHGCPSSFVVNYQPTDATPQTEAQRRAKRSAALRSIRLNAVLEMAA